MLFLPGALVVLLRADVLLPARAGNGLRSGLRVGRVLAAFCLFKVHVQESAPLTSFGLLLLLCVILTSVLLAPRESPVAP